MKQSSTDTATKPAFSAEKNMASDRLVLQLIEKEVLPRLQSGKKTFLVVAQKQPEILTLPALPGVAAQTVTSREDASLMPTVHKPNTTRDRWHKDSLLGLCYVVRGEADLLFSRRVVTCRTGDFVFFLPHSWRTLGTTSHWERPGTPQTDCMLLWLYFRPGEVLGHACWSQGSEHIGSRHLFMPDNRLLLLMELLHEEVSANEPSATITQLLWFVYDRVRSKLRAGRFLTEHISPGEVVEKSASGESVGQRAQQYVDANLMEKMTLESVARAVFTSRAKLAREFQAHTGETFAIYLLHRRIERSQHLLMTTPYTIKDIAWRSGFPDPDYFSFAFKRIVGQAPTEFRKARR